MANGYIPAHPGDPSDYLPARPEERVFFGGVLGIDVNGERQPISNQGIVDLTFIEDDLDQATAAAAQSAAEAQAAQLEAETANTAAQGAKAAAQAAASDAQAAQTAAEAASAAAQVARSGAETAQTGAQAAQTAAQAAQTGAQNAQTAASGSATAAAGSATQAAASATAAATSAATFETDTTLSVAGKAADAKATGDELTDLNSAINFDESTIRNNISQLYGKNLFNPLWLVADGITNANGESYGASKAFVDNIGRIPFVIPAGVQFTVSFDAYVEPVSGTSGSGLVFKILRADGSTLSQQIAIPNATSEWTSFQMTPNLNFGANGIEFVVSARETNITHLRNIQIEYGNAKTNYENPLTGKDKKAEDDISALNSSLTVVENDLEDFKTNTVINKHSDILYGRPVVSGKYCNPSTGEIQNLAFSSVLGVPLPKHISYLYPYNGNDATNNALRSVCFYSSETQNTTTFISGVSGTAATVANGINVPSNAVSCAVTIGNTAITEPYYLSTVKGGDNITQFLGEDIYVSTKQIINLSDSVSVPVQLTSRRPTFCFIFDDGTDGDINVKALFDSYGFKCGFALIGESGFLKSRVDRYLQYQKEGFEVLSHSVNSTAFSGITDLEIAESYLKNSLETLTNSGFNVKGWVTPSSWLLASQMPLVKKYYQYGYGHLTGTSEETAYHQFIGLDVRQLDRWGLEGNTIEQTMEKINDAIQNNAYMVFYGHSYPSTENNMTVENMTTILSFLKTKSDNGEIMVGTPNETINNFYSFRHSDLLDLYNSLS